MENVKNLYGVIFPHGDFDLCRGIFSRSIIDFKPKSYRISSVWPILLEISHFKCHCLLKVLGHFAKNWFGKKNSGGIYLTINSECL